MCCSSQDQGPGPRGGWASWLAPDLFTQLTGLLRHLVRAAEGRDGEPSACVLDCQTIKTSANVHLADQGTDAGKRIIGRKRHLGCDTLGLLLTVLVTAASVSDTAAGVTLLSRISAAHPRVTKAWADAGYRTTAIKHGARLGIDVHPDQRPPGVKGFTIIPRRWTIDHPELARNLTRGSDPSSRNAERAFHLDRQNPSTRFIAPDQKALSRS
ncbi:transposase [Streptomyces formicae]|uniref:Mobile element protein n=1 Tax=Streptomyces formicae TaxID=1616117 RepID=A0A291QJ62_9ACTN|nr:Mobile element protein [Streptomyces formicae]